MSKREKLIARMWENPRHFRFEEMQSLLLYLGYIQRQGKGSHMYFTKPGGYPISVPYHRPFLKPYIVIKIRNQLSENNEI